MSADPAAIDPYPQIEQLLIEAKKEGVPFCLMACSNEPHTPYNKGDPSAYDPNQLKLPPTFVDTPRPGTNTPSTLPRLLILTLSAPLFWIYSLRTTRIASIT